MKAKATSLQLLLESKEEYTRQFCQLCKGLFQQGFVSMFASVKEKNKQSRMILREFQGVLRVIPQWSALIIEKEEERFRSVTRCEWLQELLKGIYVVNIQILTHLSNGSNRDDSKLKVEVPSLRTFIHQCYLSMARVFWKQPFLFLHANRVEQQKNMLEIDGIIDKCIRETIRQSLPFKDLLNTFLGGTDEAAYRSESSESSESSDSASESSESDSESSESDSESESDAGDEQNEVVVFGGATDDANAPVVALDSEAPAEEQLATAPDEALSGEDFAAPIEEEALYGDKFAAPVASPSDESSGEEFTTPADASPSEEFAAEAPADASPSEEFAAEAPTDVSPSEQFAAEAPADASPGEEAPTTIPDDEEEAITYEVLPPSGGLFAVEPAGEFESVVVPPFDEGGGVTVAKIDHDGKELIQNEVAKSDSATPVHDDTPTKEIIIVDTASVKRRRHHASGGGSDARSALKKFLGIDQIDGSSHSDIPKLKKLLLQRFVEA
jgi:hypothetical protein